MSFESEVNRLYEEIRVGQVSVPRYEVDVITDTPEEAKAVMQAIRSAPRVGRVFKLLGVVTVEVNSREARSREDARGFVVRLLRRAGLEFEARAA